MRPAIPAARYDEWQPEEIDGKIRRQPYYIQPPARATLSLAGLC